MSVEKTEQAFLHLSMDKFGDIIINSNMDAANVIAFMTMATAKLTGQHLGSALAAKMQEQQQVESLTQLVTRDPNFKQRG